MSKACQDMRNRQRERIKEQKYKNHIEEDSTLGKQRCDRNDI